MIFAHSLEPLTRRQRRIEVDWVLNPGRPLLSALFATFVVDPMYAGGDPRDLGLQLLSDAWRSE